MKRFVIRPFVLVGIIFAIILLWATAHSYKWHYGLAYHVGLLDLEPAPVLNVGEEKYIAHAGGSINGIQYTNSSEAFIKAIDDGYRFIGFDLRLSLDGHYFGAHYIDDFNDNTGHPYQWLIPPTVSQIRERKILNRYTPLLLADIDEILDKYPHVMIDIDKGEDYPKMLQECPRPERMIIETTTPYRYIAARAAGFPYVAFDGYDKEIIEELGIKILVLDDGIDPNDPYLQKYCKEGGLLLITGFENAKDIPTDFLQLNALFYVDEK